MSPSLQGDGHNLLPQVIFISAPVSQESFTKASHLFSNKTQP